ncbi:MAG: fumarate hydratase [Promethearchaeota archaeon]
MERKEIICDLISRIIYKLLEINAISTPSNIVQILKERMEIEKENGNYIAFKQIKLILDNLDYGLKNKLPICQDTGMINFIFRFSPSFVFPENLKQNILESVKEATEKIPLRPNAVDPFNGRNSNTNTGANTPPIYYELSDEVEYLEIIAINKGGGAENMSKLFMLSPAVEISEIKSKIINLVREAGGKPCPPIILGIGIGGDASNCMYLAKKALVRPLFSRNSRIEVKKLEDEILEEINNLGIGVMGLGGLTTCLDVRIEWAMRHPASFPVGVIVQCYSHRVSKAVVNSRLEVEYLHK